MAYTRPTSYPNWGGTRVEPTSPQKATGFVPNFRPPSSWHNFLFGIVSDWINWLDQQVQASSAQFDYDATIGSGGTFADINALMASPNIANLKKILVITPITVTSTQVINQSDMEFVFKPAAIIAKGAATTPGISIAADRVTIRGCRMSSFSGGSDVAMQIETGIKNCILMANRFNTCTTGINDLGTNNALEANIDEV